MRFVSDILAKGGLVVDGSVTLTTTPNATVDTDKFLVQDGTVVKYRTGAEVLLDIGAQGALTLTTTGNSGSATLSGNTLNIPTYTLSGLGGIGGSGTAGQVAYFSAATTIAGSNNFFWDNANGRLGIGTNTPGNIFDILGASPTFRMQVTNNSQTSTIALTATDGNIRGGISANISSGEIRFIAQGSGYFQTFYTSNLERMRIFTSGNIAINTTTDAGFRLDVNGTARFSNTTIVPTAGNVTAFVIRDSSNAQSLRFFQTNGATLYVDGTADYDYRVNGNPIYSAGASQFSINSDRFALPRKTAPNFSGATIDGWMYYDTVLNQIRVRIVHVTGAIMANLLYNEGAVVMNENGNDYDVRIEGDTDVNLFFTDASTDRIGVGNNTPSYKLDVSGDIRSTTSAYFATSSGAVGINTTSVNTSALLQIDSTSKGFLRPRMTTTQRNAIATPATGLSVYNTTTNTNDYYDGTSWISTQNAITLTTTGSSGASTLVGTTLNIPNYTLSGLGGVPTTRTINGLALSNDQTFATGTTGTDFNIVSAGTVHTFNIPDASATARGLINAGTQTIGGTKTFTSSPIVPSLYLANMGAGSGAVYYDVPDNRLTLANYNVGGEIKFEVNGGVYTMTLNSDLTIELMGYTTNGFLKTSGGNGLLVVDTTSYTPTSRTLTINGTSFDLTANRSWSVGTVTSVGLSVPTGFSVASTPVTTSGTIALSFASGYSLPTNTSQTNWDTAYNSRISSLTTTGTSGAATLVANVLNIPVYQAQGNYITSLTGEATGSGPGATTVTLTNSAVIGKVLTGLSVTSGSIAATDSILQAFGKVQGQINALSGGLIFQGTWNANTNTPTITSGVGTNGHFYIVNVAGNTTIDGNTGWQVGDWILFDGTVWQKVDNTDAVTSVNGLTGAVVLTTTNISEGTNLYYTDARARQAISLTTTGSSGAATYSNVTGVLNIPQYTLTGLGGVPSTRTITINGVAQDLSADRSWSVGTVTSIATTGPITGGTITGSGTIGITQSSSTTSGFLSSTDWNTFNNKQNAITLTTTGSSGSSTLVGATLNIPSYTLTGLGGVPDTRTLTINGTSFDLTANRTWSVGTVTSITFSGPLTGGTITGSGTVGITQASSSVSGFLSSTDWSTFNNKQNAITLTTTGSSGAATFVGATLNIPNYTLSGLGGVPSSRTLTINGTAFDLSADRSWSVGTVTSVAALTLGTSGTDLSSSVATGTTTPVITLNVPTASATNRGALSSADWTTFNNKQNAITLTVTGNSGSATLVGATLNIPTYTLAGLGGISLSSLSATAPLSYNSGTGAFSISQSSGSTNGFLSSTDWTTFNNKQNAITLTVTGSSGSATLVGATLNIPTYTLSGLGGVPTTRTITINGTAQDLSVDRSWSVGTVTSVSATAGTGISISGSPITSSGTLTITNTGVTSLTAGTGISVSASTGGITVTNTAPAPANTVTGTGTLNYVARWTSTSAIGTGILFDNGSVVCVNATGPEYTEKFRVVGGVTTEQAYTQVNALQRTGIVSILTTTTAAGAGYYSGLAYTALTGYHENIFNGSVTIPNSVTVGGINSIATLRFNTASASVSIAQATGFRAYSVYDGMIAFSSAQAGGSVSHVAVFHAKAPYYQGANTPTITNFYGLLINDSTEYNTWVAVTNRWGVYQAGASDNNYFNGNLLLGSTVNTGLARLQVTGAIQQTSVTSSMLKVNSSGVLVAAIAGTDYLTATSSDFSYAASLTLSTTWQDTGVSATNLSTSGVYLVTCSLSDFAVGGGQYTETYVGMMYWYASTTNGTDVAEIPLHHSGHADNNRFIYLRTRIDTAASTGKIYLQIKGNGTNSGASTYTFTFKRLM